MISSLTARGVARGCGARSITTPRSLVARPTTTPLPRQQHYRRLSTTATTSNTNAASSAPSRPVRPQNITAEERAAIRAARKERATAALQQAQGGGTATASASADGSTASSSMSASSFVSPKYSRYMWYLGLGIPTVLITWGLNDPENSPPGKLARAVGLAGLIGSYTSQISAPVYDKLLPDWADVS